MTETPKPERYDLLDADGNVIEVIMWNGVDDYPLPDGHTLRPDPVEPQPEPFQE